MAEELEKELEKPGRLDSRISELSEKVGTLTHQKDEVETKLKDKESQFNEVQRERDFFASFSDVVSQNPAAKDHKDEILTKVKSGYTVEDATFAVLGKAGKLGQAKETPSPAGGSSSNPPATGTKSVSEMSQAEKLSALKEAEKRGELSMT